MSPVCVAWLEYKDGDYSSCLQTLSPLPLPSQTLSPILHLLSGACHSKLVNTLSCVYTLTLTHSHSQGNSSLALMHLKNCMERGHTPNHTPFLAALQNSTILYYGTGNTSAAMATRKLEIEVTLLYITDPSFLSLSPGSQDQITHKHTVPANVGVA